MQCGLCNLVNHNATLIYHDNLIICCLNYEPLKEPHLMVLPKRHIDQLNELNPDELKAIFDYIHKLQLMIKKDFRQETFIAMNTGKLTTQAHIHFHVLPYTAGLRGLFAKAEGSPYRKKLADKELEPLRDKIKSMLK